MFDLELKRCSSKLSTDKPGSDHLLDVNTLGFRGEALHALCSLAKFVFVQPIDCLIIDSSSTRAFSIY